LVKRRMRGSRRLPRHSANVFGILQGPTAPSVAQEITSLDFPVAPVPLQPDGVFLGPFDPNAFNSTDRAVNERRHPGLFS